MSTFWPEQRTEKLVEHFNARKSAAIISKLLGDVSRSAVLGKLYRLGLSHDPSIHVEGKTSGRKPRPIRPNVAPPVDPIGIAFDDLTERSCRWPYGDGPFTFCGCNKAEGSSYCAGHHFIGTEVRRSS